MTIFSENHKQPVVLTVPGLGGSGPTHWQSLWEDTQPDTHRVELGMWNKPHRNAWVTKLDQAIRTTRAPVILAAHSLGCLAVAWWAALSGQPYGWPVAGALLVAPADVDRTDAHDDIAAFKPSPRQLLPFPSIVVASSDDPWIEIAQARNLAASWGSHFVHAGAQGHLNAASGVGWWSEGQELLNRIIDTTSDTGGARRSAGDARAMLSVAATDAAEDHYLRPTA